MRGWVKWALAVLVPVVVYVGAYLGCCHWPGDRPVIYRANHNDGLGRFLEVAFRPALELHGDVVLRRAEGVLEGTWRREGAAAVGLLEFRRRGDGRWDLWIDDEAKEKPGIDVSVVWIVGTRKVVVPTFDAVLRVEGDDLVVLIVPGAAGDHEYEYVRIGH